MTGRHFSLRCARTLLASTALIAVVAGVATTPAAQARPNTTTLSSTAVAEAGQQITAELRLDEAVRRQQEADRATAKARALVAARAAGATAATADLRAAEARLATAGRQLTAARRLLTTSSRSRAASTAVARATTARAAALRAVSARRAKVTAATTTHAAARTALTRATNGSAVAAAATAEARAAVTGSKAPVQQRALAEAAGKDVLGYLAANQVAGTAGSLWVDPAVTCRRCLGGPALAAAMLSVSTGDKAYQTMAVKTFDNVIKRAYDPRTGGITSPLPGMGPDIETAFFNGALGLATVTLGDRLDAAHRAKYTSVVAAGARFLRDNGNLSWYTNGNINLANGVAMFAAYRLTKDPLYLDLYNRAMSFAIAPQGARWAGRGLVVVRQPLKADGSDGAAYFTEEGPNAPGFDPEYVMLQMDMLIRLDLLGAGPEIRRLLNMLFNQERPLIDTKRWTIDLSNGSRHPQANRVWGLQTAALPYLASHGRTDLKPLAAGASAAVLSEVRSNMKLYQPGLQFAYGGIWSALLN